MKPYLSCTNITKNYDTLNLNVSFDIFKGSFTTILGQSGSGKSTLLRLIAGLDKSDSKDTAITLDGKDITNTHPGKRNIGMVFQDGALFLHMTALDNVAYGLVSQGLNKRLAKSQAFEFMKIFSIQDLADKYPETLSGGECQRVALARTLIVKPKLILFDEPLSALDAPLRKKLATEIKEMQRQFGFTALMVTHDIEEAKSISDNIIFIKKGSILYQGPADSFDTHLYTL